ncbi:hypothetical protein BJ165DRAFT_1062331 [Panaeolus papilionaceus]|nr:hypothetical protein BJ165DRAFT_1062331 [Panaeolus papilionaceus]
MAMLSLHRNLTISCLLNLRTYLDLFFHSLLYPVSFKFPKFGIRQQFDFQHGYLTRQLHHYSCTALSSRTSTLAFCSDPSFLFLHIILARYRLIHCFQYNRLQITLFPIRFALDFAVSIFLSLFWFLFPFYNASQCLITTFNTISSLQQDSHP